MSPEAVQGASPALGQVAPYRWYVFTACTALNDRFEQDCFGAGLQSYFNPYAYVPFYDLVKSGLPALAVGSVLAGIYFARLMQAGQ
jgi:hypothetical protein